MAAANAEKWLNTAYFVSYGKIDFQSSLASLELEKLKDKFWPYMRVVPPAEVYLCLSHPPQHISRQ